MDKKDRPRGWHVSKEYIDDDGCIYSFGKLIKNADGTEAIPESSNETELNIEVHTEKSDRRDSSDYEKLKKQLDVQSKQLKELTELKGIVDEIKKQQPQSSSGINMKEFADQFVKATALQNTGIAYSSDSDNDPADFDEKGVKFVAKGISYIITDDRRNGQPIRTPFNNVIRLHKDSAKRVVHGRGNEEFIVFCSYISHSKKEIAWLRGSSFYNTKIFEQTPKEKTGKSYFYDAVFTIGKTIESRSGSQILQMAKDKGINQGNTYDEIKAELFNILVEEEVKQLQKRQQIKEDEKIEAFMMS